MRSSHVFRSLTRGGLALGLVLVGSLACAADAPSFTITAPAADATVTSPVSVVVEVQGAQIGRPADGLDHLHISVDGGPTRSIYQNEPQVLTLEPGQHTVSMELAGPNHKPLLPPKSVTFTVK